jgi:hypothetical protein
MCEEKAEVKSKVDGLIEAMDRLAAALWWQRADPCQINSPLRNETSPRAASESALGPACVRDGSAAGAAGL